MSIFKLCRRPEVSFVAKPGETYMEIPEIEVLPMKYSEKRPNPLGREQRAVFPEEYQAGKEAWMQPKVVSAPDSDDVSLTTGCAGLRRHVDNIRMPGILKVEMSNVNGTIFIHVGELCGLPLLFENAMIEVELKLTPRQNGVTGASVHGCQRNGRVVLNRTTSINCTDVKGRLDITVSSKKTFLGCMSFGLKHICQSNKRITGNYHLLSKALGRKKHLKAKSSGRGDNPEADKENNGSRTIFLERENGGFGFSVASAAPVHVARVDAGSAAQRVGLSVGQVLLRINGYDVTKASARSVARYIRQSPDKMIIELAFTPSQDLPCHKQSSAQHSDLWAKSRFSTPMKEVEVEIDSPENERQAPVDLTLKALSVSEIIESNKMTSLNNFADDSGCHGNDFSELAETPASCQLSTHMYSPEMEFVDRIAQRACLSKILKDEEENVRVMQTAIQQYSRPLRHQAILSSQDHQELFQNIEKLVAISDYTKRELREVIDGRFEDDQVVVDVAHLYQARLSVFIDAYFRYIRGLWNAKLLLKNLTENHSRFRQFLQSQVRHVSISTFINRPCQHFRSTITNLRELLNIEHLAELNIVVTKLQDTYDMLDSEVFAEKEVIRNLQEHLETEADETTQKSLQASDTHTAEISQRLVFPHDLSRFNLVTPSRHLVYSGTVTIAESANKMKVQLLLFNDIALIVQPDCNGDLHVLDDPVVLLDVVHLEFASQETDLQFSITFEHKNLVASHTFEVATAEEKNTWKYLLRHHAERAHYSSQGNLAPLSLAHSGLSIHL